LAGLAVSTTEDVFGTEYTHGKERLVQSCWIAPFTWTLMEPAPELNVSDRNGISGVGVFVGVFVGVAVAVGVGVIVGVGGTGVIVGVGGIGVIVGVDVMVGVLVGVFVGVGVFVATLVGAGVGVGTMTKLPVTDTTPDDIVNTQLVEVLPLHSLPVQLTKPYPLYGFP
jgi:hypothetical protein